MGIKQRFFPPDGCIPKAYGYVLVDLDMQWDRDGVIADQVELLGEYWRRFGHSIESVVAEPPGDKAYRSDFRFRPGGAEVMRLLQPGDHLVIDSLERVYHEQRTLAELLRWMMERGISLHVLRYWGGSVVIRNDPDGQATYAAVSCLADLERWRHIQRGELSRELKRKSGSAAGGQLPFFYEKTIKARGKKTVVKLVLKHWALKVMRAIEKAKDAGMNDQDVFDLAIRSAKFPSREIAGRITSRTWKGSRVDCLYAFKKAWDAAGNPDINTFRIMDLIEKYKREDDGKANVQ